MTARGKIKEALVERDANWLRSVGVTSVSAREIDQRVTAGLERAAAKARVRRPAPTRKKSPRPTEMVVDGDTVTVSDRVRKPPPRPAYACAKCGTCVRCRRELRALNIVRMARAGDVRLTPLAHVLIGASIRAEAGLAEFDGLSGRDKARVLTRIIEDVCDRSVSIAGGWR